MTAFGRYTLEEKLAVGGMAEVWLASVEGQPSPVVVKRLLPHLANGDTFSKMMLNEARVLLRLGHPNIVRVFEVGAVEGVTYIAMEYVPGSDLSLLLRRSNAQHLRVPVRVALRIVRSLCDALSAVHASLGDDQLPQRLVHRDVSPQNVMIRIDGVIKLLDFGIVKTFNEVTPLTEPGTIKGKFAYMSPEQAAGQPLDARSDLFATGLVAYELLSGVRAHRRETEPGTYQAALMGEVPSLSKVWPDVPAELEAVVAKALAVDPVDRFQNTEEFGQALKLCAEAADDAEVAQWSRSLVAPRALGAAQVDPQRTFESRPPFDVSVNEAAQASAGGLELPAERPLSLPDEPVALMPLAANQTSQVVDEPKQERKPAPSPPLQLRAARAGSFWAGVIAIGVGLFGAVGSLNDPLDGLGQWLAPIGCAGLALFGALALARLFDRREVLVFFPLAGVVLGLARGDALMTVASAGLGAALWFGNDDDDDAQRWAQLSLFGAVPAVVLSLHAALSAWLDHVPAADVLALLRRQGTSVVDTRVHLGELLSFEASGWRVRPARDVSDAQEWTLPALRATLVARVLTVDRAPPTFETLWAQATADFSTRGWADAVVSEKRELVDEADESHLVTFRVRRGLTWSQGTLRLARVDDHLCVLIGVVSERRTQVAQATLEQVARSMRCSLSGASIELKPETLTTVRQALVTLRAQDKVELGVVIAQKANQLIILADDSMLPELTPAALTYRPLLKPSDELRRAVIVRRKPGVLLLLAEADEALKPVPLTAPDATQPEVVTLGLADDGVSSRLLVRPGVLSNRSVTVDTRVPSASGPLLTTRGALVGLLRAAEGASRPVSLAGDVESLLAPGLRSMSWKITIDEAHQCTVAARFDLDDPFQELDDVALLFGEPHHEEEVRQEKLVGRANAPLTATVPCPLEKVISVGVRTTGDGQTSKLVESFDLPPEFPAARRGQRVDGTRPAAADLTVLSWLFEPPAPKKPLCALDDCDRGCRSGAGEACLLLGENLHNSGRTNLAINDYERGCVAKSFEACIQLAFLATPKTIDTYTSVLKPWCELGVRRACVALSARGWKEQLKKENADCAKSREACDREAELLLEGPRRPAEVQRARPVIERRCLAGAPEACLRAGFESQRAGTMSEAFAAFERACKGGIAQGCVELAGLLAVGVGAPRNAEAAARLLRTTCGSTLSCSTPAHPAP